MWADKHKNIWMLFAHGEDNTFKPHLMGNMGVDLVNFHVATSGLNQPSCSDMGGPVGLSLAKCCA